MKDKTSIHFLCARFCEKTVELRQVCMDLVFIAAKQFVVKFCRGASSVIELQNIYKIRILTRERLKKNLKGLRL